MLLQFYGEECPHCVAMQPLIKRLMKETKVKVKGYEVWHNPKNIRLFEECDKDGECGGVPFFYNTVTKKSLCGEVSYAELKKWAGK